MKGIDEKVLAIILVFVIFVILVFIGLAIANSSKETANPILKMLTDLAGLFK